MLATNSDQFDRVRTFLQTKLTQPGFPVSFVLPVLPAVSAKMTFLSCELSSPDASLFEIPPHYTKDAFRTWPERQVAQEMAAKAAKRAAKAAKRQQQQQQKQQARSAPLRIGRRKSASVTGTGRDTVVS